MLRTQGLSFSYAPDGEVMSFPDVSLEQGGVLLLQGDSGSGKSTLLAMCSALLEPTSGSIEVAGQDMAMLKGSQRDVWRGRSVGFLPQRLHLSESLSVQDNLALAFFAAGIAEDFEAISLALRALGAEELMQRRPSELSGGQAQRVALARAVLLRPKIILADEPTASLDDAAAQHAIALLLQSAKSCGASLVVATHDSRAKQALLSLERPAQLLSLRKMSQIGMQSPQNLRKVL